MERFTVHIDSDTIWTKLVQPLPCFSRWALGSLLVTVTYQRLTMITGNNQSFDSSCSS